MKAVTTIGLDIAKSVFQVHGIDAAVSERSGLRTSNQQVPGLLSFGRVLEVITVAEANVFHTPVVFCQTGIADVVQHDG